MSKDTDLYALLKVSKEATKEEISRSYRRLALQYHPDRNPDGQEVFKQLAAAHAVLIDPAKRAAYDRGGTVPSELDAADPQQRSAELEAEVRAFYQTYVNSEEERNEVAKAYQSCKGNFKKMMREALLYDNNEVGEVQRLYGVVEDLIKKGKLERNDTWEETSSAKQRSLLERKLAKEREEAAEVLRSMGLQSGGKTSDEGDLGALATLMKNRSQAAHESMLSDLESRYCGSKKEKKGKRSKGNEEEGREGGRGKRRRS